LTKQSIAYLQAVCLRQAAFVLEYASKMETKFTLRELDQIVYNKLLFFVDRKKYKVDRKNLEHTVEYLIYSGDNLLGIFKITQGADGVVEYIGNGAGNDNNELNKGWFILYYNMLIPIIEQEEQKLQSKGIDKENMTLGELEERVQAGDKEAIEFWEKEMTPILEEMAKAIVILGERIFDTPSSKQFYEFLKAMFISKNPLHRASVKPYKKWSLRKIKEYGEKWVNEELAKSANELPGPTGARLEQAENIIADIQGGTLTYKRNEQGQTIITGGAVNRGYYAELGQGVAIKPYDIVNPIRLNHTAGIIQPGYEAKNEQEAKAIEVVNASHNLLAGVVGNSDMQQIGETALPKIEDPTDQRIWELIKEDLSITDTALAQKLGNIGRQSVNTRRRSLEKMGYKVRMSRQNK